MNEDFFTGFDKSYIFFDDENDFIISFYDNGVSEISIENEVYVGKWRFSNVKKVLEIFVSELGFKIIYKINNIKDNKDDGSVFLKSKFLIKYEDVNIDNKSGETFVVRSLNDLKNVSSKKSFNLENVVVVSTFVLMFLFILFLVSMLPFFQNTGILYSAAIVLTIQILFIKKIKIIVSNVFLKYQDKINSVFYN